MTKHEKLIKKIRDHITNKGTTYYQLEKVIGIDRSNIHRTLSGTNIPKLDRFVSLAEAAGYEVVLEEKKNISKKVSK